MLVHKKISILLLLSIAVLFSCKKSKTTINSIDRIAGSYVGSKSYLNSHHGGLHLDDYTIDTTIVSDTFIIQRLSADSFQIHTNSPYTFNADAWGFRYNDSNHYFEIYAPLWRELKYTPDNDSIYFDHIYNITSGAGGTTNNRETFSGKKIK